MNKPKVKLPSGQVIHRGNATSPTNSGLISPVDWNRESSGNVGRSQNTQINVGPSNRNSDFRREHRNQKSSENSHISSRNSVAKRDIKKSPSPVERSHRVSENDRGFNNSREPTKQQKSQQNFHNQNAQYVNPLTHKITNANSQNSVNNNLQNENYVESSNNLSYQHTSGNNGYKQNDYSQSSLVNENFEKHLNSPEQYNKNPLHFSLTENTKNQPVAQEHNVS